ncbi:helix-turn-helix domain-containing protein [Propioniciclava coleopterorum]|uniref:Helix-turn-helix domain-containing protein n=1 Tax=Propioniciclava coleopterorum TaxID=2714937 RepID=A0A6G7Y4D2_9ACTN|nr:helix-turn-helix domain-containing protein [Propioniciclava coleopterorum]QIK71643.1 helix-turn-helix domain-containing protein [Propioniciclava coleopterorum]
MAGGTELLTVSRALKVLRAFSEENPSWGVTELANELDLDKSQVHRLLATLTRYGFVATVPRRGATRSGPRPSGSATWRR